MRIIVISINSAINHELPYMTRMLHKFRIKAEIVPVDMKVGAGGIVEDIEGPVLERYWHLRRACAQAQKIAKLLMRNKSNQAKKQLRQMSAFTCK